MILPISQISVEYFRHILLYNVALVHLVFGHSHSSLKVPPQHFNWAGIWTLCHYVDLLVFSGSLSCCMIQFWQSFSCQTDDLTFACRILWYKEEFIVDSMTARCLSPMAAKQVILSPLHQCAWQWVWDASTETLCLIFAKHGAGH